MAVGCQTCGTLNPDRSSACAYCGASLPATPLYQDPFRARPRASRHEMPTMPLGQQRALVPYAPPPVGPLPAPKDPSTALLIELIPGLFGFLGIGHLWAGQTALGLALLLGYWCFWGVVGVLTILTFGLLLCLFPFFILLYLATPVVTALLLQGRLRRQQAQLLGGVYVR